MRQLEEQRQRKQTETLEGATAAVFAASMGKRSHTNSGRSELFKRSLKDHRDRLQHFKSGGFDIAHRLRESGKKPNSRVAFGGTAGSVPERVETKESAASGGGGLGPAKTTTMTTTPPAPKITKRRTETEPNIFLNQKRTKIRKQHPVSPQKSSPPQHRSQSPVKIDPKVGKRKKSSFFNLK